MNYKKNDIIRPTGDFNGVFDITVLVLDNIDSSSATVKHLTGMYTGDIVQHYCLIGTEKIGSKDVIKPSNVIPKHKILE